MNFYKYYLVARYEGKRDGITVGLRCGNVVIEGYGGMDKAEYVFAITEAHNEYVMAGGSGYIHFRNKVASIIRFMASKERCRLYSFFLNASFCASFFAIIARIVGSA